MPTWSDGDVDATAAWFYGARLDFYLNDGAATLAPAGFLPVAAAASYAWAHDLDRDGNLDLSVVGELAPQHGGDAGSRPVAAGPYCVSARQRRQAAKRACKCCASGPPRTRLTGPAPDGR